jgi:excisionase family DNA binding protein
MVRGASAIAQKAAVRRGRPKARVLCPAEAAELLCVPVARVERALAIAAPSFFCGAVQRDGEWQIPEAALRAYLGPKLARLLTVEEFATLTGFPLRQVYRWVQHGVIEHRRVLGYVRIPETAYWALPAEMPACMPARPQVLSTSDVEQIGARSFFSAGDADAGPSSETEVRL